MFDSIAQYINFEWIYASLWVVYAATTVAIIGVILSENRNPVKSLAWVTVLLLLPIVGIILYLFFGRNIKNKHILSRRLRRRLRRRERARKIDFNKLNLSIESRQQINMARTMTGSPFYQGNEVDIFTDGSSKFESLKRDLRAAQRFINIQYYIFEEDNIGCEIRDILVERALAGVKVRLIYDHVGSFNVKNRFYKDMRKAGIEAYPFFRVSFPQFGTRINWRNHRKLCIIDGTVGYLGGMNVADRYVTGGNFASWRDTHVRVRGPIVASLQYSFAVDWCFMGRQLIEDEAAAPEIKDATIGAQLLTSGPSSQWSNIAMVFHKAISNAKQRVYIETPYFLPTEGLLKALQAAALSHIDVRIIIPRRSDSVMMNLASASYIAECMRAGIKIYFYEAGMMHSKTMLIDDEFVTVGSTNFDFRSFEHNFEANLFFYSSEFNARMADIFKVDLLKCSRIIPNEWQHRPIWRKIGESILRLLSPIL
jgi:cardiolipin synthase